jgi:hypothetical protein
LTTLKNKNSIKIILPTGKINPVFVRAVKNLITQNGDTMTSFSTLDTFKKELPQLWKSIYFSDLLYNEELNSFDLIEFESEQDLTLFLLKSGI